MRNEITLNGKLEELKEWELERLLTACDAVIAHYRRTLRNRAMMEKAKNLRGQIRAEFARRRPGSAFS